MNISNGITGTRIHDKAVFQMTLLSVRTDDAKMYHVVCGVRTTAKSAVSQKYKEVVLLRKKSVGIRRASLKYCFPRFKAPVFNVLCNMFKAERTLGEF